jgi:hypothetical protein
VNKRTRGWRVEWSEVCAWGGGGMTWSPPSLCLETPVRPPRCPAMRIRRYGDVHGDVHDDVHDHLQGVVHGDVHGNVDDMAYVACK